MLARYIPATFHHLPHGARKIALDRFHVAKRFSEAVDPARRKAHKALAEEGDHCLKNTYYRWLPGGPSKKAEQERFDRLRQQDMCTPRAWAHQGDRDRPPGILQPGQHPHPTLDYRTPAEYAAANRQREFPENRAPDLAG